ncbi:MAG: ADP-forming succinate--CoA ligase subunit beta [Acidobacteria bacterium]|nr:ADP-forming succinate--CoA ligase subunit beta [Acidobacteriota bacterium]|tara:strand:+ start:226 stop:1383 length:1158 start_codon:yes stop_codon:yes gene_type:complete
MNLHEYQAKTLLTGYDVVTPRGEAVLSAVDAGRAARHLGGRVVVKAQIHAGGRGKAGGIKVVDGATEAERIARELIGAKLVTPQTGPSGRVVERLLVEEQLSIRNELYLGILIDRRLRQVVVIASAAGGMEIEQVALDSPELIYRLEVDSRLGLLDFQVRCVADAIGLTGSSAKQAASLLQGLYRAFVELDASLIEINPLVVTEVGDVIALDAKITLDDNALFRHADLMRLRDLAEEDPLETEASKYSLSYIRLDGNIGCMVNGAGLAMATMDIVKLAGGDPANFLDVGGGANAEQIRNAFRILISDDKVSAVLINIFGGILRCDVLAEGVIGAVAELDVRVPVVIRMEGTNVDEGRRLLQKSGLNFTTVNSMSEAAKQVVRLAS